MTAADGAAARAFLDAVFGAEPPGYLLLWNGRTRRSWFTPRVDQAARWCLTHGDRADVYVGTGLRTRDLGPTQRGDWTAVRALVGFWADVDFGTAGHTKRLPPDEDAAWSLVTPLPLSPTVAVHSGGGLHLWWLFAEPYLFESDAARREVEAVGAGWQRLLQDAAAAHGWEVDSTWDLARVLRVPGTVNHKHDRPVRLLFADGPRTTGPSAFREHVRGGPGGPVSGVGESRRNGVAHGIEGLTAGQAGALVLDPAATPPFDRWQAALEAEPRFRQTWERKRKDLTDTSPSAYDLSLASQAAALGWTDQEIVNLCIAWRRHHAEDVQKALRPDYWLGSANRAGTLAKARRAYAQEHAATTLAGDDPESAPGDRAGLLATISALLGVTVAAWVQHGRERARYSLRLEDGREVPMGTAAQVLSLDQFRSRLYEATGATLPAWKRERWLRIARSLAEAAEIVENDQMDRLTTVREWVSGYLGNGGVLRDGTAEEYGEAIAAGRPFVRDGMVYLQASALRRYVILTQLEPIETHDLLDALRAAGFETRQRFGRSRTGRASNRWYWHAPEATLAGGPAPPGDSVSEPILNL